MSAIKPIRNKFRDADAVTIEEDVGSDVLALVPRLLSPDQPDQIGGLIALLGLMEELNAQTVGLGPEAATVSRIVGLLRDAQSGCIRWPALLA